MALVLGVGVGTFLVVFFVVALLLIWTLSIPCGANDKILTRLISSVLVGIAFTLILMAPRESLYPVSEQEDHQYDYSIIPRIAVACVMIVFSIVSAVFTFLHFIETKQLSTSDQEHRALWQGQ